MARDGISGAEVAKHKVSIRVCVQGLLRNPDVDTASLFEVAALNEYGKDDTDIESLSQSLSAIDLSPEDPVGLLVSANDQDGSLASTDTEDYESADEELFNLDASASNEFSWPEPDDKPRFNKALEYVDQVKTLFIHQPLKYKQFLDVPKNLGSNILDTLGMVE